MENFLKNDEFIQYIVNEYFPTKKMTYYEKIQEVFSSMKEFSKAMERFKLSRGAISKH